MTTVKNILQIAQAAVANGNMLEAAQAYQRLANTFPENKQAIWRAANGLRACTQQHEAITALETGLAHNPTSIALLNLTVEIYIEIDAPTFAIPYLERVAKLLPNQASSWSNIEAAKSKVDQQIKNRRALSAEVEVMLELAFSADQMQRYDEARANYEAVLEQDPNNLLALSRLLTFDGIEGRLSDADKHHQRLVDSISCSPLQAVNWRHLGAIAYQSVTRPIPSNLYSAVISALDQQLINMVRDHKTLKPPKTRRQGERLKIGYLSSYFRDHPIGHVIADLFSAHDRNRYDVHVFYYPNGPHAEYTDKIREGTEHFITLSGSENEMANTLAAYDLNILIYIDGIMSLPLLPVIASRPSSIQIFWLGHAGSCDLTSIDYVIADAIVIPPDESQDYATKIVRLPDTYHCASPHRIAPAMDRAQTGLPGEGFVFCAFNNPEKIDSEIFESWMRILRSVDKSVLWLSRTLSPSVETNLRETAKEKGVDGNRLIFAARVPDKAIHLSRHRHADLFLDTITLNASTTALDALWAGLPLLTVRGARFASRIAASHLHAIGLDDMICEFLTEYEERAIHLAAHPDELKEIRRRLSTNRETHSLFQIQRYCANFEKCLEDIHKNHSK